MILLMRKEEIKMIIKKRSYTEFELAKGRMKSSSILGSVFSYKICFLCHFFFFYFFFVSLFNLQSLNEGNNYDSKHVHFIIHFIIYHHFHLSINSQSFHLLIQYRFSLFFAPNSLQLIPTISSNANNNYIEIHQRLQLKRNSFS